MVVGIDLREKYIPQTKPSFSFGLWNMCHYFAEHSLLINPKNVAQNNGGYCDTLLL